MRKQDGLALTARELYAVYEVLNHEAHAVYKRGGSKHNTYAVLAEKFYDYLQVVWHNQAQKENAK